MLRFRRRSRRTTGSYGKALNRSVTFVPKALKLPALEKLKLAGPLEAVNDMRKLKKQDMMHNNWRPKIEADAETYEVRTGGELLECPPAEVLPMAQRCFLF